jgi:hypothetical protein
MAVVVESTSNTAWSTGSSTLTLTKPSGTVDGDFLIAIVAGADASGGTPTVSAVPSGWTQEEFVQNTSAADVTLYAYSKVASSEGASWNWTVGTSSDYNAGGVYRISGASTVDVTNNGTANNNQNPSYATGVTPQANSLLIIGMAATDVTTAATTVASYAVATSNPTWTESFDLYNGNSPDMSLASAYATRAESTSTGAWSLSFSAGSVQDSASFILSIPVDLDVTTNLDTVGIATFSQGGSHDVNLDNEIALDTAGILTISGDQITPTAQEYEEWTDQSKSSSNWTNQSK